MAHSASTTPAGNGTNQNLLTRTKPVLIDIRQIMDRARLSSESIVRVIAHYGDMLAGTDEAILNYLNSMADPMLQNLQQELQILQRQMATYADVMNPNSVEYHTIQANAVEAITIAEIYLSSNGLPWSSQVTTQSSPHLPATILTPATAILNPVTTQHEQLGLDIQVSKHCRGLQSPTTTTCQRNCCQMRLPTTTTWACKPMTNKSSILVSGRTRWTNSTNSTRKPWKTQ